MQKKNGFTLIELLIVVAIIAILAAIAVPNFMEAQMRAKVTVTKSDMRTIANAMEAYRIDCNSYPLDYDSGQFGGSYNSEWKTYAVLTTPIAYISTIPSDPFMMMMNTNVNKAHPYYQYNGPGKNGDQPGIWRGSNIMWLFNSVGPDITDDRMWSKPWKDLPLWSYDPTNGTKSAGDMGRSNINSYPQ